MMEQHRMTHSDVSRLLRMTHSDVSRLLRMTHSDVKLLTYDDIIANDVMTRLG
jgi:hypothetical protein